MQIGRRITGMVLAALMLTALIPGAAAVGREALEQPGVFMNQEYGGGCVVASTTMMLRRGAILRGDADWQTITTDSVPSWMPYTFTVNGMTVEKERLPGGWENWGYLAALLEEHPEGVVLHAAGVPHAVLLTDYDAGADRFYCCDPAVCCPTQRIPIDEACGTRINNSTAIWYITSDLPDLGMGKADFQSGTLAPCGSVASLVGLTE